MLPEASDYAQWLKDNPAPDLGELVRPFGRYDRIPAWAWQQFDRDGGVAGEVPGAKRIRRLVAGVFF